MTKMQYDVAKTSKNAKYDYAGKDWERNRKILT